MFERIKCYRQTKKWDKYINGVRRIGIYTDNEELLELCDSACRLNKQIRKLIIFDRKAAMDYLDGIKVIDF